MSNTTSTTKDVTELIRKTWCEGPIVKKVSKTIQGEDASLEACAKFLRKETHTLVPQIIAEGPQFHSLWHDNCTVESATVIGNNVKMTFRFPVLYEYCNPAHLLHGAAQALFYDNCMAYLPLPLRKSGFWEELGFTRNLNVNFLRTAKLGEFVLIDLEVGPAL
jgi:hypothetical protein